MTAPDLDVDALVEAGARAAWALHPAYKGSNPDSPRWEWEDFSPGSDVREYWLDITRAVLAAVLPTALKGAREALGRAELMLNTAANDAAYNYDGGRHEQFTAAGRRARSTLSYIDALLAGLGKPDETKGNGE